MQHAYRITTKNVPLTLIGRTKTIPANTSVIISDDIYHTSNNITRIHAVGAEVSSQFANRQLTVGDFLVSPITTSIETSDSSITILEENLSRKGITLQNRSEYTLYLSFTSPATTANAFADVLKNQFIILDQQISLSNAIYGIWTGEDGETVQVTEYF